jgi:FMN phosphatase YigB (HAD superfamily)
MNDPLVLSFDLDDTLWPVQPVMLAAEAAMLAWLQERHPLVMHGQDRESLRAMRVRIATQFPDRSHDMTFLRHRALAEMFAAAGYSASHADEAFEVFYAARNRVQLYDEVEDSLERLSARYRLFAISNGNASAAESHIGSKVMSPRSPPAPPSPTFASSLVCFIQRASRRGRCCTSAMTRISMSSARPMRACERRG